MRSMTMSGQLPDPRLRMVYRLEVTLGVGARQTDGVIYETYLVE